MQPWLLVPEVDQVRMPGGKAVELADLVAVVFCKLVPEVDPVDVDVLLADVLVVDVAVGKTDLVLVEVAVKVNEVVEVDEAVELADVAAIVVAELQWEGGPVQESVDNAAELVDVAVVVITELVPEDDPVQLAEILADVFEVDVSVDMADLVPG